MAFLTPPVSYVIPSSAQGGPYVSTKSVRIQESSDEQESEETTSNEDTSEQMAEDDPTPKPYDETWRWGIWQSRDARRAATGYTDQLISHMPESFRFQREVLDGRNIALGAKLLLALNAASIMLAYVIIFILLLLYRNKEDCDADCQANLHDCALGDLLIEVNGGPGRVAADLVYLLIVIPTLIYCFMREVSEEDRHVRRRIYLVTFIVIYVRLWLMFMYPVGVHCSRAKRALACGGLRHSHEDLIPECRNFGFFILNKDMGLVMMSPVVIPECAKMRPVLFSLAGLFYMVAMIAVHQLVTTPEQRYHAYFDTLIGLIFLFLVNEAARQRKWYMERADQVSFVLALRQRKASHSMFQILAYMLPSFMVTEMLRSPDKTLSDHIPRASILFIKIVDFDTMVRRLPPADLLQKLNGIFSALDNLCKKHSVTKIETVAEEYVCAVGIVPADREQDASANRHGPVVRLVYLTGDVLDYSKTTEEDNVKFQMGIHTGPVIAGVVGQKLPRFRLFGDTVNTAARMMQKGVPNEVQFGDETRRFLPEDIKYRSRGPIQMKGKGAMNAYLLIHDRRNAHRMTFAGARHRLGGRFSSTVQIAQAIVKTGTSMGLEEPDDVEMFEDALVDAEQKHKQRWIDWLDCKCGDEHAKQFRDWYYRNHLFKKLVKRLDKQLIFIFVLSFVETIYLADSLHRNAGETALWQHSGMGRWLDRECAYLTGLPLHETGSGSLAQCQHECLQYGPCNAVEWTPNSGHCTLRRCDSFDHLTLINASDTQRWFWLNELESNVSDEDDIFTWDLAARQSKLTTFICSRSICFSIILVWRILVSCSDMVASKARVIEWLLVISCCFVSCLLFLTYEMMPQRFVGDKNHQIDEVIPLDFPISGVSRNITRLIAFPVYMMTITAYPFRFFPSCVFLLGTLFIMSVEYWRIFPGLYLLPTYGDLWYFFCFNLLRQFYSFQEEKLFRTQHAAGCAVEKVMTRVHSILDTMMPKQVVKEIAENPDVPLPSHKYRMATIVQADLVGFTEMAASREPDEVVSLIEQIFKIFDDLTDYLAIYKIETVGDAYIAGMAEPPLTAHHSPVTVLRFALAMVEKLELWSTAHGENVRVRVGVHSGGCVGGVVGKEMQRYHLFGSAMPVLDLLESTSLPGCVQISTPCLEAVQQELASRSRAANPERQIQPLDFRFLPRTDPQIPTSKGELHSYAEVGGPTYFLHADRRFHTMPTGELSPPFEATNAAEYPIVRSC